MRAVFAPEGFDKNPATPQTKRKIPKPINHRAQNFIEQGNSARTVTISSAIEFQYFDSIVAFEVECTTAVYSAPLRMSDLLALQPNLEINLFLVAPDERQEKLE